MIRLIRPENGALIDLHTYIQNNFVGSESANEFDWQKLNRSERADCTFPAQIEFQWDNCVRMCILEISETADFSVSEKHCINGSSAIIGNFKAGQQYFWRVNGCMAYSFTTAANAPCWIAVEGLSNVRDIGAWPAADGRRIRQGCIYRGSEMDTHHTITAAGIKTMHDELGIRTDLDLRGEAVSKVFESAIGKDVNFIHIPAKAYSEFFDEDQKAVCKKLFEVLADSALYPIYFHCWGGADRTGTLALLLEAMLGVSEADLIHDYELTSLSIWGDRSRNTELFRSLTASIDNYGDGATSIHQKIINYLHSCGITDETLDTIRKNLLVQP